jgi:hypothetical protein
MMDDDKTKRTLVAVLVFIVSMLLCAWISAKQRGL